MAKKKALKIATPAPVDLDTIENEFGLRPKEEAFCRYYTQGDSTTFGNATWSYSYAYDYDLEALKLEYEEPDDVDEELEYQPHGGGLHRSRRTYVRTPYDKACSVCAVEGGKILRKPKIQSRCRTLLNELMRDEVVDAERAKVIMQDDDLSSKLKAIQSFDKLKGRIIDKTQDVSRLPFGQSDLGSVIATLPPERQDYFYGVIKQLIDEATAVQRGGGTVESGGTR